MPRIYTRGGDKGMTSLGTGERVAKDSSRIEAYGSIDELNSLLGVALAESCHADIHTILTAVQNDLFVLGGNLAFPKEDKSVPAISKERLQQIEGQIDQLESALPPLQNFILPGGSKPAAYLHLARAVCRRAERLVVSLSHQVEIQTGVISYLNRLSDMLFVMARYQNFMDQTAETIWRNDL